ncbi:MAG TPA: ethanolamine ammonia-lyase reactivating factor EutA [bacterium]|jgi:ethanolamine utilization protein EutA|nr:ethanolamine ammonia-lyase reactivating factor EutA [bacterium]
MHEGDEDHIHLDEQAIVYTGERIELLSVGVDIGSSTSHLIFSKLALERQGKRLSSRYVVTEREMLYRSPIVFTPFLRSGLIDAGSLAAFIGESYGAANLTPDDVDGGAVITTGEAALRDNARAVADLFSQETGKFVVATAGPNLESLLAAHGSGAADLSLKTEEPILNVDIGGGTTKFAICTQGAVRETAALHLGARLLAWDSEGRINRLEDAGRRLAEAVGDLSTDPSFLDALADHMAELIMRIVLGQSRDPLEQLWITPPLPGSGPFPRVVFSGGVAEYIYGRETRDFGDLGPRLAAAVRRRAGSAGIELLEPREGIRATCIGASQYTVQLSGDTIFLSDPSHLPLRSIPVAAVTGIVKPEAGQVADAIRRAIHRLDLDDGDGDRDRRFALGLRWRHGADYASLRELCSGIVEAVPGAKEGRPLLLVVDADVAGLVGSLLQHEFRVPGSIVCIDQVHLREFDYIDIGRRLPAQDIVPVVVKSLIFH